VDSGQRTKFDARLRSSPPVQVNYGHSEAQGDGFPSHARIRPFRVCELVRPGSLEEELLVECLAEIAEFFYEAGEWPLQKNGHHDEA
jgi:hypothetical protein